MIRMTTRATISALCIAALAGCAATGSALRPGVDGETELRAAMGPPAETWRNPDGTTTWSWPHGPAGHHSYMARLGADGKLVGPVEDVMSNASFERIVSGTTTRDEVRRLLGRPAREWFFPLPQETVWDYRYLDLGEPYLFRIGFNLQGVVTGVARVSEVNAPDYR